MEDQFWMVFGAHKSTPTYRHVDYASAVKEAERLCKLHGQEFHVLKAVTTVKKTPEFTHVILGGELDSTIPF